MDIEILGKYYERMKRQRFSHLKDQRGKEFLENGERFREQFKWFSILDTQSTAKY